MPPPTVPDATVANGVSVDGLWSSAPMDGHTLRFLASQEAGPYVTTHGSEEHVAAWTAGADAFVRQLRAAVRSVVVGAMPPADLPSPQGWDAARAMFSRALLQADPDKLPAAAEVEV